MITGTYLYIWAMVAANQYVTHFDWQYMGAFNTPAACHAAAANLNRAEKQHRCIAPLDGSLK
nr:hypothetical protein [uncultured Rhodoferax sp.]